MNRSDTDDLIHITIRDINESIIHNAATGD